MISANGGLPAHRDTPQVTPRCPRGSEPASRVAVPGPQHPVVGGGRGEVWGVDIGCGVGCAQRRVSSVRQRMVRLCSLRDLAERPHHWGP